MKVVGKMKLLKSGKKVRESAGGHATQRRRVCDGVVRMKNEKTNERHLCLSSRRGGGAAVVGGRGVVVRVVVVEAESSRRAMEGVDASGAGARCRRRVEWTEGVVLRVGSEIVG